MKKLIVKSQVANLERLMLKMTGIGADFSPVIWQHERVYLPSNYKPARNLPRLVLRTEVTMPEDPTKYSLYLKRHIEDSGGDFVHYTSVGDYREAAGIVHQLGFRKAAEVSRQRRELVLDPRTVIYLDRVEGLEGDYLKIEAELLEGQPVEEMRVQLLSTLATLGQETFVTQAYFDLLQTNGMDEENTFIIEH